VQLFVAGEPASSATFVVDNSGFSGTVSTPAYGAVALQGFTTSDGTVVLNGTQGALADLMAEGRSIKTALR
jgi:hypothetical protein